MNKIIIFGNSGSGKSTLSKAISKKFKLAHLDLDTLAWSEDNRTERRNIILSESEIHTFVESNKEWVIEGCYADLIKIASVEASKLIFINLHMDQCLLNAQNRPWEAHKYKSKIEQDLNLEMLMGWIKDYYSRNDVCSLKQHRALFDGFQKSKVMLDENANLEQLNELVSNIL